MVIWRSSEVEAIAKLLNSLHSPRQHILDVGCGDGVLSSVLFRKVFVGCDRLYPSIKKARSQWLYCNVLQANAIELPFKNRSFDMCFSNCVIEHIKNDTKVFREISRVLKTNGYFLATFPSDSFESMIPGYFIKPLFPQLWEKIMIKINRSLIHYHYYNLSSLELNLETVGLKLVKFEQYVPLPLFRLWIILRTLERVLPYLRLQKVYLALSKIFYNIFGPYLKVAISGRSEKQGGLAVLCKKI
jgi:SAM-dependent methyltransferase